MSLMRTVYVPSLSDCSPKEAADYLLHRFPDATEAATFLLQALEQIPNVQELTQQLEQQHDVVETAAPPKEGNKEAKDLLGPPASLPPAQPPSDSTKTISSIHVSGTTPRAKLEFSIYPQSHTLRLAKGSDVLQFSSKDVKHCIWFPKREDCLSVPKRHKSIKDRIVLPGSMVLWVLESHAHVSYKGKRLSQICIQLESHLSDPLPEEDSTSTMDSISQLAKHTQDSYHSQLFDMMQSTLELSPSQMILAVPPQYQPFRKSRYTFVSEENGSSSTVSSGMPWLTCHRGVQDGVLYPLQEGLLFFKPPLFVPRSQLHSISCGRGSQSSRYVDLVATLDNTSQESPNGGTQETLEFTNIDREELQVVNGYIQVLIQAMKEDIRTAEKQEEEKMGDDASVIHAVEVMESDQEEEEDVGEHSNRRKKRKQRMASKDAREATRKELISNSDDNNVSDDDDDDDDDYNFVEVVDDGDVDQDSDNDESNDAIEIVDEDSTSNDDDVEVVAVEHRKRPQRISSQEAMEATSIELKNYEGHSEDDDDDEDDDYNFVDKGDDEDDDIKLHVDSDEDDHEHSNNESETEEATDSEEEMEEPAKKKSKKI